MPTSRTRFILTGSRKAAPLGYVPALVELRLPAGFHDLSLADKGRVVEEAMNAAFEQAKRVIGEKVAAA